VIDAAREYDGMACGAAKPRVAEVAERPRAGLAPAIGHIPVSVQIVLGSVKMSVAELSKIDRGSIIRLDRRLGEPVEILVNGRFLGKGEIIVIEDGDPRFAITITQIGDTARSSV
jgi:flagellar motor switch protein FliN